MTMPGERSESQAASVNSTASVQTFSADAPLEAEKSAALAPHHQESALPEDKVEEAIEDSIDDWEHDPANGRNWGYGKKWGAVAIVALYTFVPPLASSMMAPGLPEVALKYGITNETTVAMTLCIFLLSFAIGPLFLAPLSEIYGRNIILHLGNLASLAFSLGCAFSPTTGALIAFRFLAGLSGSAPIAVGPGTIGDLFSERDRASAMAVYSLGPLIGPAVGPIAGGFIAQSLDVKYVFIVIAGLCGISALIGIPLLRETYAPVIRYNLAKKAGDVEKMRKQHPLTATNAENTWHFMWINLTRPIVLLTTSMICFLFSLYLAVLYGIYYLMFATFADFFGKTYNFRPGAGGLAYLGLGIGFLIATLIGAQFSDKIYKHLSDRNGGKGKPEFRIPAMLPAAIAVPIGLFWYGWSAEAKLHWIMPIIGTGIFGFGFMLSFLPVQLYLVDSFRYAASVTASCAVFRSLFGFGFPLFGNQMFAALGVGPGNSLLAGVSIILGLPFPLFMYFKGESMRASNKHTRTPFS